MDTFQCRSLFWCDAYCYKHLRWERFRPGDLIDSDTYGVPQGEGWECHAGPPKPKWVPPAPSLPWLPWEEPDPFFVVLRRPLPLPNDLSLVGWIRY